MLKIKSRADVMLLAHVEFLESVRRLGDFKIWKFLIFAAFGFPDFDQ